MDSDMTDEEWERRVADYEAWESSPDAVHYQLTAGISFLAVNHQTMDTLITLTVAALPEEVREFVYENCLFATLGTGINGQVLSPDFGTRWVIMLDANMVSEFDEPECLGIIAHEIAHAYLKHNMADPALTIECEREAGQQAADWFFTGIGADPEHRFRPQA